MEAEEGSTSGEKSLVARKRVGVDSEEDAIAWKGFRRTIQVGNRFRKGLLQVHHKAHYHWGYFGEKDPCKNRVDRSTAKEERKLELAVAEGRMVQGSVGGQMKQSCSTIASGDEEQRGEKCPLAVNEPLKGRKLREIVVLRGWGPGRSMAGSSSTMIHLQ